MRPSKPSSVLRDEDITIATKQYYDQHQHHPQHSVEPDPSSRELAPPEMSFLALRSNNISSMKSDSPSTKFAKIQPSTHHHLRLEEMRDSGIFELASTLNRY